MSGTMEQRLTALDRANEIRLRRAELHRWVAEARDIHESVERTIEVLEEREEAVQTLAVGEFLLWPRRWGRTRARRTLNYCRIPEAKRLGAMTERQVTILVCALARRGRRETGAA